MRNSSFVVKPLALACLALLPATAHSADEDNNADTMVVTASGFEQRLEDAPASVTVISGDDLRKRSINNLADALRDVEGVAVPTKATSRFAACRAITP